MFGVGSAIRMNDMPENVIDAFVRTFARLPHRVIWQWRGSTPRHNLPGNIKTVDWLPQQDLLGHDKCRLFLTHGGLNSIQEAVYHSVPILGFPFGSDQWLNLGRSIKAGYALSLEWDGVTEETLSQAIQQLLYDPKYVARFAISSILSLSLFI